MAGQTTSSIHPPPLPTTEDDAFARLRLLRSRRVGVATYRRLMNEHGTGGAALKALVEHARAAGLDDYEPCPPAVVAKELAQARRNGAHLIAECHAAYPAALHDLDDAPPFLWALGDPALLHRPAIALVGARNASSLGLRMAKRLAQELAEAGFVVVSGLARGIDAAAHRGALDGGTVAVQAGGVDTIYPKENADLARDIATKGLRLSEAPMGLIPVARHFPPRNRIISGLARAVIVVEAAAQSGSLITARNALDQGRDVFAVPGHPFDARAAGCNMLIRDGACLSRNAADVIDAIGPITPEQPAKAAELPRISPDTNSEEISAKILSLLSATPQAEDVILRDVGQPRHLSVPALTALELGGKVTRMAGGLLSKIG